MTNQPLSSGEQGKLLLFALLFAPTVIFLVGIIPAIFLGFGIFMMKRNQDFSSVETAVRYFKVYCWIGLIGCSLSWVVNQSIPTTKYYDNVDYQSCIASKDEYYNSLRPHEQLSFLYSDAYKKGCKAEEQAALELVAMEWENSLAGQLNMSSDSTKEPSSDFVFQTSTLFAYLVFVQVLFFNPLKSHSEWISVNGIFSSKPKSAMPISTGAEVDIIKGEKLKKYSVADELIKWAKLKEDGHITEEEFDEARTKLLKRS
jgi:hypothetical protein